MRQEPAHDEHDTQDQRGQNYCIYQPKSQALPASDRGEGPPNEAIPLRSRLINYFIHTCWSAGDGPVLSRLESGNGWAASIGAVLSHSHGRSRRARHGDHIRRSAALRLPVSSRRKPGWSPANPRDKARARRQLRQLPGRAIRTAQEFAGFSIIQNDLFGGIPLQFASGHH